MRTIKFRGKSLESGEWLYGDLIHYEWESEPPYPYIQTGMGRNEHGIMQTRGGMDILTVCNGRSVRSSQQPAKQYRQ